MVDLCACISLGYPIDAPVDVLHGDPRFLFLSDSSSDVDTLLSPWMRSRLFSPLPDICDSLEVLFMHSSKTLDLIKYYDVDSSSCCVKLV